MAIQGTILLIDNDTNRRMTLAETLAREDLNIEHAIDFPSGREMVARRRFDLIIADLATTEHEEVSMVHTLRTSDPTIGIILCMNTLSVETIVANLKSGICSILLKPYNQDELKAVVNRELRKRDLEAVLSLYEASQVLHSSLNYTDIVAMVPDLVAKTLHADNVGLMVRRHNGKTETVELYCRTENTSTTNTLPVAPHECPADPVLQDLEGLIDAAGGMFLSDAKGFSGLSKMPDGKSYGSILAYALKARHHTIGSLILLRTTETCAFVNSDLKKGMIFAGQLALALDNTLLRDELESRLADLEAMNATLSQKSIELENAVLHQEKSEERFRYMVTHDSLTNLPNRLLLHDRLSVAITRAKRFKQHIAFILLDLDNFKEINDSLGHILGDKLIREAAKRIVSLVRECDTVARMGGDEFIITLSDLTEKRDATVIIERIHNEFAHPFTILKHEIVVSPSIGISFYPDDGDDIEILLKDADIAMYNAKAMGGNNYCHFSLSMNHQTEEKMLISSGLRKAIENNELVVYYQPLVEPISGQIAGIEALLRWERSKGMMVSPLNFIPIAESTGLIVPIGEWVLATACRQNVQWQKEGYPPVPIAVNLSARQLHEKKLFDTIIGVLDETGLAPEYLILEITESTAMENVDESISILTKLYNHGIQIFIDDFGSGYSSIGRLKNLPVHALKIDHLFTQHIVDDPNDAAIVMSIMAMAHSLDIRVVVEGVETREQLERLRTMKWTYDYPLRCDEVQGYLFSRPIPAEDFTKLFIRQQEHGKLLSE